MPYGPLSIASYVKDKADIKIFDCNIYDDFSIELNKTLKEFEPDLTGLSLMFDISYQYVTGIIDILSHYNTKIIAGGTAATPNYKQILKENPEIEAVCYGEGELPIKEYIENGIFSTGWATRNNVPSSNNIFDLDKSINIDYSMLDNLSLYQQNIEEAYSPYIKGKNKRQFTIITSRGCPYSCTFCMNSLNPDKTVRYASVDSIINQVGRLTVKYGMNVLTFYDDQILHNKKRAMELFTRLKPYNLRIEMPNGVSISALNEPIIKTMKEAGVDSLYLALESGSKEMLKVMRKPVNLDKTKEIIKLIRKYDYFIFCFLVIGLPEETDRHRQETIDYIREIKPDLISPKPASPVYGSALRKQCIEKGYIKEVPFGKFEMTDSVIKTETNDPEDIMKQAIYMNYRTNFVENYRMSIGDCETARHYFRYVAKKYPDEIFAHYFLGNMDIVKQLYKENKHNEQEKFKYFQINIPEL